MNAAFKMRILRTAVTAARESGKLLRKSVGRLQSGQIQKKAGANNFVTDIDRASEKLIVKAVRRHFPGHAILAEEGGSVQGGDITWIIDPIDGTSNFIHSFPLFSISIGVACEGRVFAGVVYDPSNDELFSAVESGGARLNGKPIRVSGTRTLSRSLMVTGIPFRGFRRYEPYMRSFKTISLASAGMRRGGSAALDLAYVACGRLDGYWEIALSPWDIAAGSLLVREAGGTVTDLRGGDSFLVTGDILATNKRIHRDVQKHTTVIPPR